MSIFQSHHCCLPLITCHRTVYALVPLSATPSLNIKGVDGNKAGEIDIFEDFRSSEERAEVARMTRSEDLSMTPVTAVEGTRIEVGSQ